MKRRISKDSDHGGTDVNRDGSAVGSFGGDETNVVPAIS